MLNDNIKTLKIDTYNGDLTNLPNSIKELHIFDSKIKKIIYPPNLKKLYITGFTYNLFCDFPLSLNILSLSFIEKLDNNSIIELPYLPKLKKLYIDADRSDLYISKLSNNLTYIRLSNYKYNILVFPLNLLKLELKFCNYNLLNKIPLSLTKLDLTIYSKPNIIITFPYLPNLKHLSINIYFDYNDYLIINKLSDKLLYLDLHGKIYNSTNIIFPSNLITLKLLETNILLNNLPNSLKELVIEYYDSNNNIHLPPNLEIVHFSWVNIKINNFPDNIYNLSIVKSKIITDSELPKKLKKLYINDLYKINDKIFNLQRLELKEIFLAYITINDIFINTPILKIGKFYNINCNNFSLIGNNLKKLIMNSCIISNKSILPSNIKHLYIK
jgi:hypothetical protein